MYKSSDRLAIDFGTSNSAAARMTGGQIRRIPLEAGADTIPTSLFFNAEDHSVAFGKAANLALADGQPGRYMRSLKSVLGTSLKAEKRMLNGRRMSGYDVVASYISHIKNQAEAIENIRFTEVVSGRPVHFHSADATRDARAENDLRQCYHIAGFERVDFVPEPVAAALSERQNLTEGGVGLVVDIGGGTSDFAVFRNKAGNPQNASLIDVLAAHGIRLGGTDFDRQTSIKFMMPFLGRGAEIGRPMGAGTIPAPKALYSELSTWQMIPFLYNAKTLRDIDDLIYLARDKRPFQRLRDVIEHETGHDLAMLTEATKIALNETDAAEIDVPLDLLERGLSTRIEVKTFDQTLSQSALKIQDAVGQTLTKAGIDQGEITDVIEVGGGGRMTLIRDSLKSLFPNARFFTGATFTAVVDGLAIASTLPMEWRVG